MKLTKFIDELPIPRLLMPIWKSDGQSYYEVTMTQFTQQLHSELPPTTLWGYEGSYPGPTIEVQSGEKTYIKWKNHLPDQHLLHIDTTVHGAHKNAPGVRTVVHVHGASVEWESDGHPEAWFTKNFRQVGPYYRKKIYQYDNLMRACTLWYHDHTLGITRLNVYAGLAGFYIIRDEQEKSLNLPMRSYDIPLVIQDKSFNEDGSLYYPSQPEKKVQNLDTSVVPEFFGNSILVNGKVYPFLKVEPRKYRFRLLNASNSRFFRLKLDSGQYFYQIATERSFREQPIGLTEIILAPAERVEIIIDFTNQEDKEITLTNDAPAPFPSGILPDDDTNTIMQFKVVLPLTSIDTSSIPAILTQLPKLIKQTAVKSRNLTLDMKMDSYGREVMLLDDKIWDAPVSENPKLNTTEIWYLINLTTDTHPIHLHLVDFQILDRRDFDVEIYKKEKRISYTGPAIPPESQEMGWKDTVRANPDQVTRIIMNFGPYTGYFVWHCHILEHEDYEMMRPFIVIQ